VAVQTSQQVAGPGSGRGQRFSSRRLPAWLVVAIPIAGELLLGGYRIAGPSLWRDEAATISGSNRPAGAIWDLTSHQDAVHGLYYLLIHAVIAVGGTSETALRLPSLIAMALAAGLTAELGRRLARKTGLPAPGAIGLLAGLLLAVVPLTTRYAQEARPYALTTLFAVAATYLLVRAVEDHRWPWWAGYAVAVVLTGLFNLFALLLVVAHGLTLLAARSNSRSRSRSKSGASSASRSAPARTATTPAPVTTPAAADTPASATTSAPASAPASAFTKAPATTPASAGDAGGRADAGGRVDAGSRTGVSAGAGRAVGSDRPGPIGQPLAAGVFSRWLVVCGAAAVVLAPVAVFSVQQSAQLNWVRRPDLSTVATLVRDFAGITALIPVVGLLALLGCAAGPGVRRGAGLTLAVVTLPWLVVPPVLLLAVSLADPLYVERYVMFCLPALSILAAAGLIWLAELTRGAAVQRGLVPGRERLLAVIPSAVLAIVILAALVSPQRAIRQPSARADNLRAVTAVVAANERQGDAIWYLPWDTALVGMAYPAPFAKLRDIGQGSSPIASATLRGLPASPGVVTARLRTVSRVWTVQWVPPAPSTGELGKTLAASGLHLVHRWQVQSVVLTLYAR
jgi:mannosyltransferase